MSPLNHHTTNPNAAAPPTHVERIFALTSLLNDVSCHHPFSNIDPLDPEGHPELRSYYYLATLLTTGVHEHNCAVTAISLAGVVKCVIADTDDKHDKYATNGQNRVVISIVPEGTTSIENLGSAPSDADYVAFEKHVGDVCHALRTFPDAIREMSNSPGAPSPYWAFLRFIVRRCHQKIADRMLNGEKIWRVHPMTVLQTWYPTKNSTPFTRHEFPVRHQILQSMLSLYGIKPLHDEDRVSHAQTFYFADDNARDWAQVACALYGVLEKRLLTPYFDGTMPPKNMPRASMDIDSITTAADYLDTFSVMLELPPMRAILSHELFVSKLELVGYENVPTEDEYANGHEEPTVDHAKEERESAGEHVYRYLRAIVAWVTGILYLTQNEALRNHIPVHVYRVRIPPAPQIIPSAVALKAVRADVVGNDEAVAGAQFDTLCRRLKEEKSKSRQGNCAHVEAVLMSILFSHKLERAITGMGPPSSDSQNQIGALVSVFQQGYVAIGGTHNCCYTCWWLADSLSLSPFYNIHVALTGTHGLVRPWAFPEQAGLDAEEAHLGELDGELVERLRGHCTTNRHSKEHNGENSNGHKHMLRKRLLSHLSFGFFG